MSDVIVRHWNDWLDGFEETDKWADGTVPLDVWRRYTEAQLAYENAADEVRDALVPTKEGDHDS